MKEETLKLTPQKYIRWLKLSSLHNLEEMNRFLEIYNVNDMKLYLESPKDTTKNTARTHQ